MNDPHSASGLRTRSRSPEGVIVALSLCMALQMTSFVIPLPLFALRLEALGAGVKALGISAMAFALTSTLAAPFMGALADRLGRRYLMLVSLAAYVAAYTGYLLAPSAAVFIGVRGLAGAFTAGLMPAVTGLAADLAPGHRVAQEEPVGAAADRHRRGDRRGRERNLGGGSRIKRFIRLCVDPVA